MPEKNELSKVLEMIVADMENDAKNIDRCPFNSSVAEYFGKQGAAITALARTLKVVLEQMMKNLKKGR